MQGAGNTPHTEPLESNGVKYANNAKAVASVGISTRDTHKEPATKRATAAKRVGGERGAWRAGRGYVPAWLCG